MCIRDRLHTWLQCLPQALQRYDVAGRFDALFGTLVPLVTLAVVAAGGALVAIVVARLALSVLNVLLLARSVRGLLPHLRPQWPQRGVWRSLGAFSFYSWLQRLAALTTQNADKLLLGAQQSMAVLAAYVIPLTLGNRVFGLLYRLMQAVFPLASALSAVGELDRLRRSTVLLQRYTLYLNVCVCLLCAVFSRELLHYWLQGRASQASALVLVLVAYTLLADALTHVPSLVNDGLGHPRVTAGAALLRAALGLAAAWWAVSAGGIVALAVSQLVVSLGMGLGFLWWVHRRSLPWSLAAVARPVFALNAAVLAAGTLLLGWRWGAPVLAPGAFAGAGLLALAVLAALGWWGVLYPEDRARVRGIGRRWAGAT